MMIFLYDLRRTARLGRLPALRAIYGLALLIALGSLFARWFPEELWFEAPVRPRHVVAAELASFSERFTATYAFVQIWVVVLLTPALLAGAVAEERRRRTLDLLLTSDLSAVEIVLGKLAARVLHLLALLLTGLPVLALAQLWGGAEPRFVLASLAISALTLVSLGALTLFCSTLARTVAGAAAATYLLAAVFGVVTVRTAGAGYVNPVVLHAEWLATLRTLGPSGSAWVGPVAGYALFHLLAAVLLVAAAALALRGRRPRARSSPIPVYLLPPGWWSDFVRPVTALAAQFRRPVATLMPQAAAVRVFPVPPVGPDPLLWRELHFGGSAAAGELTRSVGCVVALLGVLAFLPLTVAAQNPRTGQAVTRETVPFFASLVMLLTGGLVLGVAVAAAGSVSRERERGTLDSLLTLPGGRLAVLRAKLYGSLLRVRWLAAALVPVGLLLLFSGGLDPSALPLLASAAALHVLFAASLGVCVSVWVNGTGRATVAVTAALLGLGALPWLLTGYAPTVRAGQLVDGLSPPLTWWRLLCDERRWARLTMGGGLDGILIGLGVYAAAAFLLLWLAHRRFGTDDLRGLPA